MPFILPQTDNRSTIDKFHLIVEKYKHVIANDPTARCMIGFAAATMIRNEGDDMDLDSIESWLASIEMPQVSSEECSLDDSVDKIMSVLADTTIGYCDNGQEDHVNDDTASSHEFTADDQLNRYVSRNPYTSAESYHTHVYIPNRHPLGNLFLPLEFSC